MFSVICVWAFVHHQLYVGAKARECYVCNMHTLHEGHHLLHQLGHVYRHVIQYQKSNMLHKTTIKIYKTMNYQIQALLSWLL